MVFYRIQFVVIGLIMGSPLKPELCSEELCMSSSVKLVLEARVVFVPVRHLICGSERVGTLCLISSLSFVCALLPDFNMPLRVYLWSPSETGMFSVTAGPPCLSSGVFGWNEPDSHLGSCCCCLIKRCHEQEHILAGQSVWLGDYCSWLLAFTFIYLAKTWFPNNSILSTRHSSQDVERSWDLNLPVTWAAP